VALNEWFKVIFDDKSVLIDVVPPNREKWSAHFDWDDVIRICFKIGDLFTSDELYIFTNTRPESYLIPIEANGGLELWNEIVSRGLFDAGLAIKMVSKTEGLFCWPPDE